MLSASRHVERQDPQALGRRQDIRVRGPHRGDDGPVAIEEIAGGLEAEARGASGDEDGVHDGSFG
ncbi:hypothetical protein ACRAWD_30240 [Caulobacter segnis]